MEMEAKLVINAEKFFSTVYTEGNTASWNIRTEHMANTVDEIIKHVSTKKRPAKVVIWQHNMHVGDSSATHMAKLGQVSLSNLLKDRYGKKNVFTIGMTTSHGTIYASPYWDKMPDLIRLPPAAANSYDALLHNVTIPSYALLFRSNDPEVEVDKNLKVVTKIKGLTFFKEMLSETRPQRTIGAIYDPNDDDSHYLDTNIGHQYDCMFHIDRTTSLIPFDLMPLSRKGVDAPKFQPFDM
jgi:erythromycin esterase-like protein